MADACFSLISKKHLDSSNSLVCERIGKISDGQRKRVPTARKTLVEERNSAPLKHYKPPTQDSRKSSRIVACQYSKQSSSGGGGSGPGRERISDVGSRMSHLTQK
ncbi:hypothetical protein H4Q26_011268 [Puccinia striiformis f. sp. tritici PST-130]|nr:hypothetical protein H4Q26_011268 [Puccinia striiformis f. sp. tritici PST-130]